MAFLGIGNGRKVAVLEDALKQRTEDLNRAIGLADDRAASVDKLNGLLRDAEAKKRDLEAKVNDLEVANKQRVADEQAREVFVVSFAQGKRRRWRFYVHDAKKEKLIAMTPVQGYKSFKEVQAQAQRLAGAQFVFEETENLTKKQHDGSE